MDVGLRTGRSIGVDDCYSFLTGSVLKESLFGTVITGAGKS